MEGSETYSLDNNELVRIFILDEVCDDFEPLDMVVHNVESRSREYGLLISSATIVEAMTTLLTDDLVAAYDLINQPQPQTPVTGQITNSDMLKYYYYLTKQGRAAHRANSIFFDDEGTLLKAYRKV